MDKNKNYNVFECVRDIINGPQGAIIVVGFYTIMLYAINRGFRLENKSEKRNFSFSI